MAPNESLQTAGIMSASPDEAPWVLASSRYRWQHIIGSGCYGTVSAGYDTESGREVAIKRIDRVFDDPVTCKRILREIAILRDTCHDCVVRAFDVFYPPANNFNELYIVMEICDQDMKQLIKEVEVLTIDHVKHLMYNLFRGLKYLHSAGICHRDLKPANCLVHGNCEVKIADFNLSVTMGDALASDPSPEERPRPRKAQRQLTQHVATRYYRAPEVILLDKGYSFAIDIWGAACTSAELLQTLSGGPPCQHRRPLFPGGSCLPISGFPRQNQRGHGAKDQLGLIFEVIGTPSPGQVAKINRTLSRNYVETFLNHFGPREPVGVGNIFPYAPKETVELIDDMLRFLPDDRINVEEALAHCFFLGIRNKDAELVASERLELQFEAESESQDLPSGWTEDIHQNSGEPFYHHAAFGITTWVRPAESTLDELQLRQYLVEEVDKFRTQRSAFENSERAVALESE